MKNLVNRNLDEFLEEGCSTPTTKKGKERKFDKVMHKYGKGKLKSSSKDKVTHKDQALAIGFSEIGESKPKK